jgi:xylulokinase
MSLLGLDIGTTGCKAIAFSVDGKLLAHSYREYGEMYPRPGWAEIDPNKVWKCVSEVISDVANQVNKSDPIKALSVTTLGEAFTPIAEDGTILSNSMTSVDNRAIEQTESWKHNLGMEKIFQITGMSLHPSFSINKMMWLKKEQPEIFNKAKKLLLYQDFTYFKLGLEPTIDYSLASRTMAFDIRKKKWSDEILSIAGIDPALLATPRPSGEIVGEIPSSIAEKLGLPKGTVAVTGGHDQPVNALGGGVVSEGVAVDGLGSVECIIVGFNEPPLNEKMLNNNYPVYPHVKQGMYVSLAFSYTGGNLLRWYRNNFAQDMVQESQKTGVDVYDLMLKDIPKDPTGIYVLPHFVGSGTPALDPDSKGVIAGLTLGTTREQFVKSLIEGITYELRYYLTTLEDAANVKISRLRAMGGGAKSPMWLQLKADVTGKEVIALAISECGCLGAAILAGVGIGEYSSVDEAVKILVKEKETYHPNPEMHRKYTETYGIYKELYPTIKDLVHKM